MCLAHGSTYLLSAESTYPSGRVLFFIYKIEYRKSDQMSKFNYKEQYAVIVICKDEQEQETIYNRLNKEGYKLKVVAV